MFSNPGFQPWTSIELQPWTNLKALALKLVLTHNPEPVLKSNPGPTLSASPETSLDPQPWTSLNLYFNPPTLDQYCPLAHGKFRSPTLDQCWTSLEVFRNLLLSQDLTVTVGLRWPVCVWLRSSCLAIHVTPGGVKELFTSPELWWPSLVPCTLFQHSASFLSPT